MLQHPPICRSAAVGTFIVRLFAVLGVAVSASAAEEDRSCDGALFEPITVSTSEVSGRAVLETLVRTRGLELELQTDVDGDVELAEEYQLGLDVLDEIAGQLGLEWTQYGCRIIVAAPGELRITEIDTGETKPD